MEVIQKATIDVVISKQINSKPFWMITQPVLRRIVFLSEMVSSWWVPMNRGLSWSRVPWRFRSIRHCLWCFSCLNLRKVRRCWSDRVLSLLVSLSLFFALCRSSRDAILWISSESLPSSSSGEVPTTCYGHKMVSSQRERERCFFSSVLKSTRWRRETHKSKPFILLPSSFWQDWWRKTKWLEWLMEVSSLW